MSLISQFEWPMFYLKYECIVLCILGETKIKYYYYYYKPRTPALCINRPAGRVGLTHADQRWSAG